jgi:DNA-binding SARP family transcriptional activator
MRERSDEYFEAAAPMRINVLGPLEVIRDGVLVTPSAPKLRQVLSLMALQANKVVLIDQFIEELWGEQPPHSATTTLQTYIYQLRKMYRLAGRGQASSPDGAGKQSAVATLHTSTNGYLLSFPNEDLDWQQVAKLVKRGREQLDLGDISTGAETLGAALQLWRGSALADVSRGPVLQATVVWFDEFRKNILEQRVDAELRLGKHRELIGELTGLAAEQPTNEGIQAKLILALYRSGRRSDALNVYQRARLALVEELGLEPSPELQRLHQSVLAADPDLDAPDPPTAAIQTSPRGDVPSQLPARLPRLLGQESTMATVRKALTQTQSPPPVVAVVGPPGSGKTTICVQAAQEASADYPDGQFYAELTDADGKPIDPADILADFLRAIGLQDSRIPDSLINRMRVFRSWTATRRVLVVLDDVVSGDQIHPLLPTGEGSAGLVGSRCRIAGQPISTVVPLSPFGDSEGMQFVADGIGWTRVNSEPDAARELIALCDGLPLALRSVVDLLQSRSHWPLSKQVFRMRRHLDVPHMTNARKDLYRSVRRTYRQLSTPMQAVFLAACRMEYPVRTDHVAELLGVDKVSAEFLLDELVQFQLAQVDTSQQATVDDDPVYRLSRPVRDAARSLDVATPPMPEQQRRLQFDRSLDQSETGM